jgi:hypothetical protein
MFDSLQALGIGVIGFAIIIGVGSVVLGSFGTAVAGCPTSFTYNTSSTLCTNSTGATLNPSGATQNVNYLNTQMGSTGGGLASYTPVIIALSVGLLFLGAFMVRSGKKY